MSVKTKFDKHKCAKCRYRGMGCGASSIKVGSRMLAIYCNYCITGTTCLKADGKNVVDRRGKDYNNCKLFEEGPMLERKLS